MVTARRPVKRISLDLHYCTWRTGTWRSIETACDKGLPARLVLPGAKTEIGLSAPALSAHCRMAEGGVCFEFRRERLHEPISVDLRPAAPRQRVERASAIKRLQTLE